MKSITGAYLSVRRDGGDDAVYDLVTWQGGLLGDIDHPHTSAGLSPAQVVDEILGWVAAMDADDPSWWVDGDKAPTPTVMCFGSAPILPLLPELATRCDVRVAAKTAGCIYCVSARPRQGTAFAFRIWDVSHMDRRPLDDWAAACGRVGAPDHVVIAMHLRQMLDDCPDVPAEALGGMVVTATGMARAVVRAGVGALDDHFERSLKGFYSMDATQEAPRNFRSYATRKASARGGFTFAAARWAGQVLHGVRCFDETSAHHAQALGHWVPERFEEATPEALTAAAQVVAGTTVDALLRRYHWPWPCAFHACIRFEGLRLRAGSVWEHDEVGLLSMTRIAPQVEVVGAEDEAAQAQEAALRATGYADEVDGGTWAFGHLMSAKSVITWVTDLEVWCMSRVYEWDSMVAICGEATGHRKRPDDQATLSTMTMYAEKAAAKARLQALPPSERRDAEAAYIDVVKARYNAIGYGIHAMDDMRPSLKVTDEGEIVVDGVICDDESFEAHRPRRWRSWYVYGTRIAGWSRVALIVAAELVWRAYGDRAGLVCGDTDSLKYIGITEGEFADAVLPLHEATGRAIHRATDRARRCFCRYYSSPVALALGKFEYEGEYVDFVVGWPKAYAGVDGRGAMTLKLAGVPRQGEWSLTMWAGQMVAANGPEALLRLFRPGLFLDSTVSQVVVATYRPGQLPKLEHVAYNVRDLRSADTMSTLRWQAERGRDASTDSSALATWQNGRAYLFSADGDMGA